MDFGVRSVNAPAGYADTKGAFHDGISTTAIFFRGTEDMGGGTTANFQWEINPDLVGGSSVAPVGLGTSAGAQVGTSNTGATGNNFLGLKNATAGELKIGRLNTGTLSAWGTASVFGTKLGSGYGSSGQYARYGATATTFWNTAPTRFNNAFEYTTPAISGFTGRAMIVPKVDQGAASTDQATATTAAGAGATVSGATNVSSTATGNINSAGVNRVGAQDLSLAYNNGPLNVIVAQQTIKVGANGVNAIVGVGPAATANTTHKLTTYAANYKIDNTTVYGGMWTEKQDTSTAVDVSGRILGVKHTIGAYDLLASTASTNSKATTNIDRKIIGFGANYNMSKRTIVYARYENRDADKNTGTNISTNGVTKTIAAGLKHSF